MSRHQARETAFRMIYQMDVGKNNFEIAKETMLEALVDEFIIKKDFSYIEKVVLGVAEERNRLDDFIIRHTRGWSIHRMNPVEKNIIRMVLYEIWFLEDVPYEVALNEGIELAKSYGDDDAYGFVNGILDNAKNELKAADVKFLAQPQSTDSLSTSEMQEKLTNEKNIDGIDVSDYMETSGSGYIEVAETKVREHYVTPSSAKAKAEAEEKARAKAEAKAKIEAEAKADIEAEFGEIESVEVDDNSEKASDIDQLPELKIVENLTNETGNTVDETK